LPPSAADRVRLLERLAELGELDELMRERGTLAPPDEMRALHSMRRDTTTERTTSP
jgi:hypothetical protein